MYVKRYFVLLYLYVDVLNTARILLNISMNMYATVSSCIIVHKCCKLASYAPHCLVHGRVVVVPGVVVIAAHVCGLRLGCGCGCGHQRPTPWSLWSVSRECVACTLPAVVVVGTVAVVDGGPRPRRRGRLRSAS